MNLKAIDIDINYRSVRHANKNKFILILYCVIKRNRYRASRYEYPRNSFFFRDSEFNVYLSRRCHKILYFICVSDFSSQNGIKKYLIFHACLSISGKRKKFISRTISYLFQSLFCLCLIEFFNKNK